MTGGKPNGMFVGAAKSLIEKVVPAPLPKERELDFAKAQQNLLSQGVTAIADMGTTIDDWQSLPRAGDRWSRRTPIISYAAAIGNMLRVTVSTPTQRLYTAPLRCVGGTCTNSQDTDR